MHADDPEFGCRFIADELEAAGHRTCERRVWRLCRNQRVWSTTTKKGRRSSGTTPGPPVHTNLVQRVFSAPAPDVVWLTDITEHPTVEEIAAVANTLNSRPRKTLGWRTPAEAFNELLLSAQQAGVASVD